MRAELVLTLAMAVLGAVIGGVFGAGLSNGDLFTSLMGAIAGFSTGLGVVLLGFYLIDSAEGYFHG